LATARLGASPVTTRTAANIIVLMAEFLSWPDFQILG
jgi:hypothetical protein